MNIKQKIPESSQAVVPVTSGFVHWWWPQKTAGASRPSPGMLRTNLSFFH